MHCDLTQLAQKIKAWSRELGFQQAGITDTRLSAAEQRLEQWLALSRHGDMHYMQRHGRKRSRPALLHPGTLRVISVRMDYWPEPDKRTMTAVLEDPARGYVSRYALGRDYHKLMRKRLAGLAARIRREIDGFSYRAFVDSAPVLEKPLAHKAGLGWIGKHTNLINKNAGSWFFLGELYTNLPLPVDTPATGHCGSCRRCIDVCPTGAITAPYELDARLCISYLTIELHGAIPEQLRPLLGNRIYGCDDCQAVCPWNKFAATTRETDFLPRQGLESSTLVSLFGWTEQQFLQRTEGSAIRRIGHIRWLRNIAVALGNALASAEVDTAEKTRIIAALQRRTGHPSALVREHTDWALRQRSTRAAS